MKYVVTMTREYEVEASSKEEALDKARDLEYIEESMPSVNVELLPEKLRSVEIR